MSKSNDQSAFIPVLTSQAGCCLTAANWQEAGINTGAFHLSSLLMKPGYEFLNTLPDLATYVGWQGRLVLNASLPAKNAEGFYKLCSHYDGRRISHTDEEILALIKKLQPTMTILPEGALQKNEAFCNSLSEKTFLFLPANDLPESLDIKNPYGVYLSYDAKTSFSELIQQLAQYKKLPCYIAGDLSLPLMRELVDNGAQFVESDRPASDACMGQVYCAEGELSLKHSAFSKQFEPIDKKCNCPTCSQQFTRAYLHHLLEHTPLLCQRLLVQHNVHYCQEALGKK